MAPSLSHSLLLQSRWQLDRKRNRKGLKDLLLLSFSFKDKWPSDNFPQCSSHGGLCGYEKAQESDRQPPQLWGEEVKKKKTEKGLLFFLQAYFPRLGRSAFVGSIWVHLSQPGILEDPCALSGCRVWACSRVAPYCCCEREELKPAD